MTVPSELDRAGPYNGNGVTTSFQYKFRILNASHLLVVRTEPNGFNTVLTLNTDYTVTGIGNTTGGNVVLVNANRLPSGRKLSILRNLPFTQEIDLENQGAYYAETVEEGFDRAAMRDQQLKEGLSRAIKAPMEETGIDMTMPDKATRANKYLSFDSEGRPRSSTFDVDTTVEAANRAVNAAAVAVSARDVALSAAANAANDVRLIVKDDADRADRAADRAENAAAELNQQVENVTPDVMRFSGDDLETEFDLERPGLDERLTNVYVTGVYQQKDTYSIVDGVLIFDAPPITGTDNIEVVIGGNAAQAFAIPANETVGPEKLTDELRAQLAYFQTGTKRRSMAFNGNSEVGGNFPRTPVQEVRDTFSGGNPLGDLPNQAATDMAECLIIPPTEESTNYVFPTVPWMSIGGANRRVMPVDIRTCLVNSPLNIPLFEPVKVNGFGFLSFRFIGDEPLHTILKGSISILARVGATSADAYARHILRLRMVNPPPMENGENNGTRNLAGLIGSFGSLERISNYNEFNDACFPIDQALRDLTVVNNWTNLWAGSVNGFFNLGDTDEALRTSDDIGPINTNVRTSAWMNVSAYDKLTTAFYFDANGTSKRRRIQIKTATGAIRTFNILSSQNEADARVVYRLPADAAFVRVYYSTRDDTASSERFIAIGPQSSANYDPLKGYWSMRHFNVHREVAFYPGVEYFFDLYTEVADGGSGIEWGFRFQSGGLSFMFDAGRMRKKLAKKLFRSL